jgi:hypothetical protein
MLKFSPANAKTDALYGSLKLRQFLFDKKKVYSLDLSAGHSCPGAKQCLAKVVERDDAPGRFTIQDGPKCEFRCFSASQEAVFPGTRKARRHNFDLLRKTRGWKQCRDLLADSLPVDAGVIRYHVSGDFFKLAYLQGAIALAKLRPDVLFYTYTKSLPFLVGMELPSNFIVTVSRGGKHDHLIEELEIREAKVVYSEEEAKKLGWPIDHTDELAATNGGSFCLLIHGVQPKGSKASLALSALNGKGTYSR